MAKRYEVEKDGKRYEIEVGDDMDLDTALSQAFGDQPAAAPERGLGGDIAQGLGFGARTVVGAAPKAAGSVLDLVGSLGNLAIGGLDKVARFRGGDQSSIDYRLPTNYTQLVDEGLTSVGFPEAEGGAQQFVGDVGEIMLQGGAGGAALAPKIANVAKNPQLQSKLALLGDEIGQTFARSPKKFAAAEAAGATGAAGSGDLAEQAGAGPGGQLAAEVIGGLTAGLIPTAAVNTTRRVINAGSKAFGPGSKAAAESMASDALKAAQPDIEQAVARIDQARPGVAPGTATGSPRAQQLENKLLTEGDAAAQDAFNTHLKNAEESAIDDLSRNFGDTTDPQVWKENVISTVTPDDVPLTPGQPDEMLQQAFNGFTTKYGEFDNIPISTRVMRVEGGDVSLPEALAQRLINSDALGADEALPSVSRFLARRVEKMQRRGERTGGPDDDPRYEVDSQDMFKLRQDIRQERRRLRGPAETSAKAQAQRDLFNDAEDAITDVLESQLAPNDLAELRALDAKYGEYKTVEDAVARGKGDLTPQQLQAATARRTSRSNVARGDTGRLGSVAESALPVKPILAKNDVGAATRRSRSMSPEELQAGKADFNSELIGMSQSGGKLNGEKFLRNLKDKEEVLRASGFDDADLARMDHIGRELTVMQTRSAEQAEQLLTNPTSQILRFVVEMAGARGATHTVGKFAPGGGAGVSLKAASFGSQRLGKMLNNLSTGRAEQLLRDAMEDPELYKALLTRGNSKISEQAKSANIINAWIANLDASEDGTE